MADRLVKIPGPDHPFRSKRTRLVSWSQLAEGLLPTQATR